MKVGKVAESVLLRSVFKKINVKRDEVLIGSGVGEDCSILKIGNDESIVLSCDPITATKENLGELAAIITLNDIAAAGAEPIGLMTTIMLPPEFTEEELANLMQQMNDMAATENVQIIGGHTEVTNAVNQPIISVTGVGKIKDEKVMIKDELRPGLDIVMTKWTGIEGSYIIAKEASKELSEYYNEKLVKEVSSYNKYLSIVKDASIATNYKIFAMHDVTEGGIYGALWEIGCKAGCGLIVDQDDIPIKQETIEICEFYGINPYKLIGSGSLVIVTDNGRDMIEEMKENGINAAIIGKLVDQPEKIVIADNVRRSLKPAEADELYAALEKIKN